MESHLEGRCTKQNQGFSVATCSTLDTFERCVKQEEYGDNGGMQAVRVAGLLETCVAELSYGTLHLGTFFGGHLGRAELSTTRVPKDMVICNDESAKT